MEIKKELFGRIEGEDVHLFVLANDNGMNVKIMTYGAAVTSISLPGEQGKRVDLACGFDKLENYFSEPYKNNAPYFGKTIGRNASWIKNGKFTLNEQDYQLAANVPPHQLHGGPNGFSQKIWKGEIVENEGGPSLVMSLHSPDMEEGCPGNLDVKVVFSLDNDNQLKLDYKVYTDKETPVSMTNHAYFNLSGFSEDIKNHLATVYSSQYLVPDEDNMPDGKVGDFNGSVKDLRKGRKLGDVLAEVPGGFENYFLFDGGIVDSTREVARFEHPESGRQLIVSTTEPGMLFYTGVYTSDELQRENGDQFGKFRAFCCEAHRYPNGVNINGAPGAFTKPDAPYTSSTVFKFSW